MLLGKDGSRRVAKRLVLVPKNPQVDEIEKAFRGLRRQGKYLYSEMTRPDCNFEVALAFHYGGRLIGNREYEPVKQNILSYLATSNLQVLDPTCCGLGQAPSHRRTGSDDNTWNAILPLKIYLLSGDDEWLRRGLLNARGLLRYPNLSGDPAGDLQGRPHWGGMRAMGLAFAFALTGDADFKRAALDYLHTDYKGLILDGEGKPTKRPHTTSESSYFLLENSLIARATGDPTALECVRLFGDYLISRQDASGIIPGETRWGAAGDHVAPCLYAELVYSSHVERLQADAGAAVPHGFSAFPEHSFRSSGQGA